MSENLERFESLGMSVAGTKKAYRSETDVRCTLTKAKDKSTAYVSFEPTVFDIAFGGKNRDGKFPKICPIFDKRYRRIYFVISSDRGFAPDGNRSARVSFHSTQLGQLMRENNVEHLKTGKLLFDTDLQAYYAEY